jgi:hypothetical protein
MYNFLFKLNNKVGSICLVVMAFWGISIFGDLAKAVAATIILFATSAVVYVSFRILKATLRVFKPVLKSLLLTLLPEPKKVAPANKVNEARNVRLTEAKTANVKRQMSGEEICTIPAYARKAQGICYPMTLKELNRPKFTVVSVENGMSSSEFAFAS